MLSFSCMDCIDRTERCHATCERYAKYKKEIEIIKQAKEWESLANSRMCEVQPTIKRIRRIADTFNCTIDEFLSMEGIQEWNLI